MLGRPDTGGQVVYILDQARALEQEMRQRLDFVEYIANLAAGICIDPELRSTANAAIYKGVFVNPALTEPFGLTLLEAAASGLPVVATRAAGS